MTRFLFSTTLDLISQNKEDRIKNRNRNSSRILLSGDTSCGTKYPDKNHAKHQPKSTANVTTNSVIKSIKVLEDFLGIVLFICLVLIAT